MCPFVSLGRCVLVERVMTDDLQQLHPIERAMIDLSDMERARIFARTPVDGVRQAGSSRPAWRLIRLALTGLSAAACLLIAVGIARVVLENGSGQPGVPPMNMAAVSTASLDWNGFSRCLSGPGRAVDPTCRDADYDADGDVDMVDFREFQVSLQNIYP